MGNSTVNGVNVMKGRIQRPRVGNWVAELVADAQDTSSLQEGTAASLVTDGGTFTFTGTILRSDAYAQNVSLRVVGGSNGLANLTKPRFYSGVPVSQPLGDALSDAGETLSGASIPAQLSQGLAFWTMVQQQASQQLSLLANAAGGGCVWRVMPDGSVFFGVDGFSPTALSDYELISYLPLEKLQEIASEAPTINPGESFNGFNVSTVEHVLRAEDSRVRLWFE
jgi:hypothetical protein